jgi:hypothetical protein
MPRGRPKGSTDRQKRSRQSPKKDTCKLLAAGITPQLVAQQLTAVLTATELKLFLNAVNTFLPTWRVCQDMKWLVPQPLKQPIASLLLASNTPTMKARQELCLTTIRTLSAAKKRPVGRPKGSKDRLPRFRTPELSKNRLDAGPESA